MEDHKEEVVQPSYSNIFGKDIAQIPVSERKRLAAEYIANFANKTIDDELLRNAGVGQKTTDPLHFQVADMFGGNIVITELIMRTNYCLYLQQLENEMGPLPYTDLYMMFSVTPQGFEKKIEYEGEKSVFIPNHF